MNVQGIQTLAMGLSVGTGFLLLAVKVFAYLLTGSAAVFSDAAESVVHVVAVGFAAYSLRLSRRAPNVRHPFGYDKISFFSAGFEGALIMSAAGLILWESTWKWIKGAMPTNLGPGAALTGAVIVINGVLGLWLIRTGKLTKSLILEANGHHVLTDSVTSLGAVAGLLMALWTGQFWWDPLLAILAALNILKEGGGLVLKAFRGLLDETEPSDQKRLEDTLNRLAPVLGLTWHEARLRSTGQRFWIQVHLLMPGQLSLDQAHSRATALELSLAEAFPEAVVTTHLEPAEHHDVPGHQISHFSHEKNDAGT